MSLTQIHHRLDALGFHGMFSALEGVLEQVQKGELQAIEAIDLLLEKEWANRQQRAISSRIKRSKIRNGASLEDFDLTLKRGLTKTELKGLSQLSWCDQGKPLILIGPTGVGKTYLARSLGTLACENGKNVLFMTITEFLEHQAIARSSNGYLKFREKLIRPDLLILDDFGMRKFSSQEAEDLRDVIEQRSYGKSTLITTQLPTDHWGEVIGDEIILDALVDRLEPPGLIIKLTGESFRKKQGKKVDIQTT